MNTYGSNPRVVDSDGAAVTTIHSVTNGTPQDDVTPSISNGVGSPDAARGSLQCRSIRT